MSNKYEQICNRLVNAGLSGWQVDAHREDIRRWCDQGYSAHDIYHQILQSAQIDDFDARFRKPSLGRTEKVLPSPLPKDFQPSVEVLEYLHDFQKIPMEFIAGQLIEFKLYWQETGEARTAWQSRFKTNVISQWKRSQSEELRRSPKTAVEKLTDRSWAEGTRLDEPKESTEE